MSISFSPADRLAITRRQIKIEQENETLLSTVNTFNDQKASFLQVDNGNKKFYDFYDSVCQSYENEARLINGQIPDTYTPSDVVNAAINPSTPPFYPSTPSSYTRSIPLIQDGPHTNNKVKGFFHPIGTDPRYEQNILSNTNIYDGLQEMIFRLSNGISSPTPTVVSTTTPIPAGNVTNLSLSVLLTTGFSVNSLVYINQGSASGIYRIVNIIPSTALIVNSVIPTQIGMPSGGSINNNVAAFSASERQTLSSALYNELLNNIANRIFNLVLEWELKVDGIITALSSNEDNRSPQNSQNLSALNNANTTKSTINTWKALPPTGVSGRYTSSSISIITTLIGSRLSFLTSRLSEIAVALGTSSTQALSQSGDNYSTAFPNNPYYNRYKWLNFRINRTSGSLRRYYGADQSKGSIQQLLNDNNSIKNEYNSYFLTKAIIFNDGSDIIHVKNTTGLSVGDSVVVVSETQPEISRNIIQVLGTTQLKLNAPVPLSYKVEDLARVFKIL